jgi:hypothetical protein
MHLRSIAAALVALWVAAGCYETVCTCPDGDADACTDDAGTDATVPDEAADSAPDEADSDTAEPGDADAPDEAEADVPPPPRFSFAVIADSQFATTSCTSGVSERTAVPRVLVDLAPAFVLEAGDLMDRAAEAGAYDQFENCYAPFLPLMPFFPTMGNHDAGSGGILAYKTYLERRLETANAAAWSGDYAADFPTWYEDDPTVYSTDFGAPTHTDTVPSGVSFKTFYAFRHANAYFVSMEIGTRWWSNTPTDWLDRHLAAAQADPAIDHVFVFLHHPIYSTTMADSGTGECTGPVREHYDPIFHARDVTMVFSGHAHVYDRFWVPDDGHRTADAPPTTYPHDGNGVHYIVTGGAGGPLPTCSPMPAATGVVGWEYSQARGCGYHVTLVEVDGPRLTVRVIGVEGGSTDYTTSEWDRFTIE